jgi:hypothetical protein
MGLIEPQVALHSSAARMPVDKAVVSTALRRL